ncbi:MAG: DUF6266 family protein [Bacteroidota bacterium]
MGTYSKGILGGFSGTVGTVVGGNWKGISYMRSQSGKRSGPGTPAQLAQQARFALAMKFLVPFTDMLRITFRDYAVKMTGINNAQQYLLANSITGTYPAYTIDYALVLVSRGSLPNAIAPAAAATGTTLNFTWTNNAGNGRALATDQALLVAFCPDLNQVEWQLNGATRSDGAGSLNLSVFAGHEVVAWMGFVSADGRQIASSQYNGAFNM